MKRLHDISVSLDASKYAVFRISTESLLNRAGAKIAFEKNGAPARTRT
jgi:hypothetical protein